MDFDSRIKELTKKRIEIEEELNNLYLDMNKERKKNFEKLLKTEIHLDEEIKEIVHTDGDIHTCLKFGNKISIALGDVFNNLNSLRNRDIVVYNVSEDLFKLLDTIELSEQVIASGIIPEVENSMFSVRLPLDIDTSFIDRLKRYERVHLTGILDLNRNYSIRSRQIIRNNLTFFTGLDKIIIYPNENNLYDLKLVLDSFPSHIFTFIKGNISEKWYIDYCKDNPYKYLRLIKGEFKNRI